MQILNANVNCEKRKRIAHVLVKQQNELSTEQNHTCLWDGSHWSFWDAMLAALFLTH